MGAALNTAAGGLLWRARTLAVTCAVALAMALVLAPAFAQAMPSDAEAALERGEHAAEQAREIYADVVNHPDQALWRQALQQGRLALELAPDHPRALRFLAETYGYLRWNVRAWDFWLRYMGAVDQVDEEAAELAAKAGNELGYSRYQAGDMQGALERYGHVYEQTGSLESLKWLARIYFELGDPQAALPYWQEMVERSPEDQAARYYLDRTQQRIAVGVAASDAFHAGIVHYEQGNLQAALEQFEAAARHNPSFKDAHVWAGRVAFEAGRSDAAERHWGRVRELDPGDARAEYFLHLAGRQREYGAQAALSFYDAQVRYGRGDYEGALERMQRVVAESPDYPDAIDWISRLFAELEAPERAIAYWEELKARHPEDESIAYHLELARDQREFGVQAARALARGMRSYQLADFDAAREAFIEATEANPDYAEAWAWRARLAFDLGRYADAGEFYRKALELEPGNESFEFFAQEAERLARPAAGGQDD